MNLNRNYLLLGQRRYYNTKLTPCIAFSKYILQNILEHLRNIDDEIFTSGYMAIITSDNISFKKHPKYFRKQMRPLDASQKFSGLLQSLGSGKDFWHFRKGSQVVCKDG